MSDQPGRWYGESDGDTHNKTFYAYRENSAFPGGVERKDFDTRAQLNKFLSHENNTIT